MVKINKSIYFIFVLFLIFYHLQGKEGSYASKALLGKTVTCSRSLNGWRWWPEDSQLIPCDTEMDDGLDGIHRMFRKGFTNLYGFRNREGRLVVPPKYVWFTSLREDRARVEISGQSEGERRYGFIDGTGHEVVEPKYHFADLFFEGLARVKTEAGLWGYINREGGEVIPAIFEEAWNFRDGVAIVKTAGKYGYIDTKGTFIISARFDNAGYRTLGDCFLHFSGLNGIACKEQVSWISCEEAPTRVGERIPFNGNGFSPVLENGAWWLINRAGEKVAPLTEPFPDQVVDGCARIREIEQNIFFKKQGAR